LCDSFHSSMLPLLLVSIFLLLPASTKIERKTKYNETLAEMLLHLSAGAYGEKKEECVKNTFPAGEGRVIYTTTTEECDIIDSTCELFIVASKDVQEMVIVFRGTKKKTQLLLEGWHSYAEGTEFNGMGKVNGYFANALHSLWKPIYEILNDPEYKNHSIIFTGHSLGGALASLAAAKTVKIGIIKGRNVDRPSINSFKRDREASEIKVYTFGQPRTGSFQYAKNYDDLGIETYRIVYSTDIVPHQPPCKKDKRIPANKYGSESCFAGVLDGYYHHGTEIWYPENMTRGSLYLECLGAPKNEDFNCSNTQAYDVENKERYIWDHRHYFDVTLSNFGKSGCTNRTKNQEPMKSKWSKMANLIWSPFG
ncbi:hypothetical protein PFISCL1PPCAC_23589, partial [Pristionchus fissidentatus]